MVTDRKKSGQETTGVVQEDVPFESSNNSQYSNSLITGIRENMSDVSLDQNELMEQIFELIEEFVNPGAGQRFSSNVQNYEFSNKDAEGALKNSDQNNTLSEFIRPEEPLSGNMKVLQSQGGLGGTTQEFNFDPAFSFNSDELMGTEIKYSISSLNFIFSNNQVLPVFETPFICKGLFLFGTIGSDILEGTNCRDVVTLSIVGGTDIIDTKSGDDSISVAGTFSSTSSITSGEGNDSIVISGGVDNGSTINSGDDNDTISSGTLNNSSSIDGGAGDDIITTGSVRTHSSVDGGDGNDTLNFGLLYFGARVYGGDGNDTLNGTGINNASANGDGGDDIITMSSSVANNGKVNGGAGNDIITVSSVGGNGKISGNDGNDTITIENGVSSFLASVNGNAGNDTLILNGIGIKNNIFGGADADTFLFTGIGSYVEIEDFSVGDNDVLDISALLVGYDPMIDLLSDFVRLTDSGADSILEVDVDGGADGFAALVTLIGNAGLDASTLEMSGNLELTA